MVTLPEGRRGRALAVALPLLALAVLWLVLAGPALDWFDARADRLGREEALAARMEATAAALPALEREAAATGRPARATALLPGGSDALASAALQERLGALARDNGVALASSEALPARPAGRVRRIALRLVLTAPYPALVALLRGMAEATPTMLVDDLGLRSPGGAGAEAPLEVALTVSGFRPAGDAP